MKQPLLIVLLCLSATICHAQTAYSDHIQLANSYFQTGEYNKSATEFSKAFLSMGNKGYPTDRYNAACAWAKAGNADSAFYQLGRLVTIGYYQLYSAMLTDPDLNSLHADKRWEEVRKALKQAKDKAEVNLNKPLVALLDSILHKDQDGRRQIGDVESKYGRDSKEMKALWQSINDNDSADLVVIKNILDTHGWLGADEVGNEGSNTLFLVIQHSDIKAQEQYLPMMRDAVKKGKAQASSLALLEDRVALRQGKKQIYGSQVGRNTQTGEYYVSPLQDPDNVDKRRAEVGLQPIAEYVKNWGMTWDVAAYKKKLPEIEADFGKIKW